MLSISTLVSGSASRIRLVAIAPFMLGSAKSMTTTFGRSCFAASTASNPSLDSPSTRMPGSSSSIRRNPRRTRLWSSTSSTLISVGCMYLHFTIRRGSAHERSARVPAKEFNFSIHQIGAFPHGNQSKTMRSFFRISDPFVLNLNHNHTLIEPQPDAGPRRFRVTHHVAERLLHHAVKVYRKLFIRFAIDTALRVFNNNPRALLESGQVRGKR